MTLLILYYKETFNEYYQVINTFFSLRKNKNEQILTQEQTMFTNADHAFTTLLLIYLYLLF